jgi:hypothetical protein
LLVVLKIQQLAKKREVGEEVEQRFGQFGEVSSVEHHLDDHGQELAVRDQQVEKSAQEVEVAIVFVSSRVESDNQEEFALEGEGIAEVVILKYDCKVDREEIEIFTWIVRLIV